MNPAFLAPRTLLRDTTVTGVLLTALGALFGEGDAVALGAAAGLINLLAWLWVAASPEPGRIRVRMLAKQLLAPLLVIPLCLVYSPLPVMAGFCALLLTVSIHSFYSVLRAPVEPA